MRRLIWPLLAGVVALALALTQQDHPPAGTTAAPDPATPPPLGRPVALTVTADGRIAVGGQGGSVQIFDAAAKPITRWVAHGGAVRRILDAGGDLITVGDGSVARWSPTGERRWRLRLQEHSLNDLAIPDLGAAEPAVFVGADRGSVARLGEPGWHRRGSHGRATFAVVPWRDGVASGGADGTVVLWSLDGDERLRWRASDGWVTALAVDGEGLVVGDSEGRVTRWTVVGDEPTQGARQALGRGAVIGLATRGGRILAGTEDGAAFVIDPGASSPRALIAPAEGSDPAPLSAVALTDRLAYALDGDRHLRGWDPTDGRLVVDQTLPTDPEP